MLNLSRDIKPGLPRNTDVDTQLGKVATAVNALSQPIVRTVFANATANYNDWLLLVDASAGAVSIALPLAANATRGIAVKKVDSSGNAVTLVASGSDKIDGAATFVLAAQYNHAELLSDNKTGWWVT